MDASLLMALEIGRYRTVPISDALHRGREYPASAFLFLFNRNRPAWSVDEWADVLMELHARKFICFYRHSVNCYSSTAPRLKMSRDVLVAALEIPDQEPQPGEPDPLYYALTPEGGACWEDGTQADWSRYLDSAEAYGLDWTEIHDRYLQKEDRFDWETSEKSNQVDRLHVCLTTLDRDALEAAYAEEAAWQIVVPDSRRDFLLGPWQPCYWKTLPFGYRLGYSVYSQDELQDLPLPCKTHQEREDARSFSPNWYRSTFPPHPMSS